MKKYVALALLAGMAALPSLAQGEFGARYSNYQVDLSVIGLGVDTDRASSIGLLGSYRSGPIIFRGFIDHDFDADVGFFDFLEVASFERDRAELSLGYMLTENFDIEGAVRFDSITVGVGSFLSEDLSATFDGFQAGVGATFHSRDDAQFGWQVTGRYFFGQVDVDEFGSVDVSTLRLEAAFPIRLGDSPWTVLPGVEYEQLETDDDFFSEGFLLDVEGNRFFIGLLYEF